MGVVGTHFIDNFLMLVGEKCVSVGGMVDMSPMKDCRNNPDDDAFMCTYMARATKQLAVPSFEFDKFCPGSWSYHPVPLLWVVPFCVRPAIQGETNIEDPGGFGILKMESGLVATVCAGNSLSGGASIRL